MPSFDIVSKVTAHEIVNAVDQANREVKTRFDFKDSDANFAYSNDEITLTAPNEFQIQQMQAILDNKLIKRGIDLNCLERKDISKNLHEAKQIIKVKQGIEQETGKKITRLIKDTKLKVQTAIMGDHIRITGKNRDDLQDAIALLKNEPVDIPLQFENFRD